VHPKASNIPQNPTQVQPKDVPSYGNASPNKNGKVRGNRTLANHPPSQILDQNFQRELQEDMQKK